MFPVLLQAGSFRATDSTEAPNSGVFIRASVQVLGQQVATTLSTRTRALLRRSRRRIPLDRQLGLRDSTASVLNQLGFSRSRNLLYHCVGEFHSQ